MASKRRRNVVLWLALAVLLGTTLWWMNQPHPPPGGKPPGGGTAPPDGANGAGAPAPPSHGAGNATSGGSFTIANWNLQIFGDKKEADPDLMAAYARILSEYDIAFVQEIRDSDGSALPALCARIPTHRCVLSSKAGRTDSKEQYGILYRQGITLVDVLDHNPDAQDRWERPPVRATFEAAGARFSAYNIHIKPDDVGAELTHLQALVGEREAGAPGAGPPRPPTLVLGDFNADCSYYAPSPRKVFADWLWAIPDSADTTTGGTNCAYDRILLDPPLAPRLMGAGVRTEGINASMSDHYLVWARIAAANSS